MRTLEEIDQLNQSGFGRPQPRHGLKLLYWFTNDGLFLDQNNIMLLHCSPMNGDFGFHKFENRYERNGAKLLPDEGYPYYAVGNLSKPGALNLPHYVWEHYTRLPDDSNMDRLIISISNKWIHSVYVTEHSNRTDFKKQSTYRISKRLIKIIRSLDLEAFLLNTGYSKTNLPSTNPLNTPIYLSNQQAQTPATTTSHRIPGKQSSRSEDIAIDIDSPSNQQTTVQMSPDRMFIEDEIFPNHCNCVIL